MRNIVLVLLLFLNSLGASAQDAGGAIRLGVYADSISDLLEDTIFITLEGVQKRVLKIVPHDGKACARIYALPFGKYRLWVYSKDRIPQKATGIILKDTTTVPLNVYLKSSVIRLDFHLVAQVPELVPVTAGSWEKRTQKVREEERISDFHRRMRKESRSEVPARHSF